MDPTIDCIKKMADVSSVPPAVPPPAAALLCCWHLLEPESVQEPPPGGDQDILASILETSLVVRLSYTGPYQDRPNSLIFPVSIRRYVTLIIPITNQSKPPSLGSISTDVGAVVKVGTLGQMLCCLHVVASSLHAGSVKGAPFIIDQAISKCPY